MFEQAWKDLREEVQNSAQVELKDNISKAQAKSLIRAWEFVSVCSTCTLQQAFSVYFVLELEDSFKLYLENLTADQLKKLKREFQKNLHPDKNSHPEANKAF